MQPAQNASTKKLIFGHLKLVQVMKQKQDSTNAQSANIFGESIDNFYVIKINNYKNYRYSRREYR